MAHRDRDVELILGCVVAERGFLESEVQAKRRLGTNSRLYQPVSHQVPRGVFTCEEQAVGAEPCIRVRSGSDTAPVFQLSLRVGPMKPGVQLERGSSVIEAPRLIMQKPQPKAREYRAEECRWNQHIQP